MDANSLKIESRTDKGGARTRIVALGASIKGSGRIDYGVAFDSHDGIGLDITRLSDADGFRVDLAGLRRNDTREPVCSLADPKWKSCVEAIDGFTHAAAQTGPRQHWNFSAKDRAELVIILAKMRTKLSAKAATEFPEAAPEAKPQGDSSQLSGNSSQLSEPAAAAPKAKSAKRGAKAKK